MIIWFVVYYDVYGLLEDPFLRRYKHFITFMDKFNKKKWVFFIKAKSGSFGMFKKFRVAANKQFNRTLKFLTKNGGGEYTC